MLHRSVKSNWARAAFFEKYNDIDVYVEDNNRETKKLYSVLLSNAFGEKIKLDCVFPLGPRHDVLEACRNDQAVGGRPRVYIFDGDLDLCHCKPAAKMIRLYRLPRYCIENFLIDESAAALVLSRESDSMDVTQVLENLNFKQWFEQNAKPLRRLFTAFAATNTLVPSIKTVGIGYSKIVTGDNGLVDPLRVEAVISGLREAVDLERGPETFVSKYREFVRMHSMKSDEEFVLHFVSGKDYLLPLLRLRMHKTIRHVKPLPVLKVNLAECLSLNELGDILGVAC